MTPQEAQRLLNEAEHDPGPDAARAAVDAWRHLVDYLPDCLPDWREARAACLSRLGLALRYLCQRTGSVEDATAAVEAGQAAVEATPRGIPEWAAAQAVLAQSLRARAELTADVADVTGAVEAAQAAVDMSAPGDPGRRSHLGILSGALTARFQLTGETADLERAIEVRRVATAIPADPVEHARGMSDLGMALGLRFRRTGDTACLDEAIDCFRAAMDATPIGHPPRGLYLSNLGTALLQRFDRTGETAELERSIESQQAAVDQAAPGSIEHATYLSRLAGALLTRCRRTGRSEDLDLAIAHGEAAAGALPEAGPLRAGALSHLGNARWERFERTGSTADLDGAVEALRTAVAATPEGSPDRVKHLANLGGALQERYHRLGGAADLDHAVETLRAAVAATHEGDVDQAGCRQNLGLSLGRRFDLAGDLTDLHDAVHAQEQAVALTPVGHPKRAMYLCNLGIATGKLYGQTGAAADAERSVTVLREAVDATPDDHPDRAIRLYSLGTGLRVRYEATGDGTDLDQAVGAHEAAVAAAPADESATAEYTHALGLALAARYGHSGRTADLTAAVSACTHALGAPSARPLLRVLAARTAARLVAPTNTARAADLLEAAVGLLPEVNPRRLERDDRQRLLGGLAGLAGDAAALALADTRQPVHERAARALRLLESGRAVLLSQALDTRGDLTDLRERHPEPAARFAELRVLLDGGGTRTTPGSGPYRRSDVDADVRRRWAREFAATVTGIRALDGFASFGLPPSAEELRAQAEAGPVVVFNVSGFRSDALLLTRNGVTAMELPALSPAAVSARTDDFHRCLRRIFVSDGTPEGRQERKAAEARIRAILEWLWDTATGPVLDALGHRSAVTGDEQWPTVWWAPGGLLGRLPLHAAGHHDDPVGGPGRRTVLDRVVSSYTPTVRALRHARQRAFAPTAPTPAGLIVAMPTTPGAERDLRFVPRDVEAVRSRLPGTVVVRQSGTAAPPPRRADVLALLPDFPVVHFSCHGISHPGDPSQSRLLLHDHIEDPFTVAGLAHVDLTGARLAFMSACETAVVDVAELADEAIHLTSAFQLAGFPHVVGTLWAVDDELSVGVAEVFYDALRADDGTFDTGRAAGALHRAVRTLRDGFPKNPSLWAAYVHAGA